MLEANLRRARQAEATGIELQVVRCGLTATCHDRLSSRRKAHEQSRATGPSATALISIADRVVHAGRGLGKRGCANAAVASRSAYFQRGHRR